MEEKEEDDEKKPTTHAASRVVNSPCGNVQADPDMKRERRDKGLYKSKDETGAKPETTMRKKAELDHIAINVDLAPIALLLLRFRKHQLPHPVNALVARFDGEVVRLGGRGAEDALLLRGGDELEAESRRVVAVLFLAVEFEGFEGGVEFVGGERGTRHGVLVDVDVLEGIRDFFVAVHGEAGAVEPEMVFVPLVAEHFGLALFHPAGMVDVTDRWGQVALGGDGRQTSFLQRRHSKAWLTAVRGRSLKRIGGSWALDGRHRLATVDWRKLLAKLLPVVCSRVRA